MLGDKIRLLLLGFLLSAAVPFAAAALAEDGEVEIRVEDEPIQVVEATDANFEKLISEKPFSLAVFYADWCEHSKKLLRVLDNLVDELNQDASAKETVAILRIDATKQTKTADRYRVNSFPVVKVFREGRVAADYTKERTLEALLKFIKASIQKGKVSNRVVPLSTLKQLRRFQEEEERGRMVILVAEKATSPEAGIFAKAAELYPDLAFGLYTGTQELWPGAAPGTVLMYHGDDAPKLFNRKSSDTQHREKIASAGLLTLASLTDILQSELATVGIFDELDAYNFPIFQEIGLPMGWVFLDGKTTADASAIADSKATFRRVAKKFEGKVSMFWVDSTKFGKEARRLGLTESGPFPAFVIDVDNKHHIYTDSPSDELQLTAFVAEFVAGETKPTVRSQKSPSPSTLGGMTTVVGDTFDTLVTQATKPVLIQFHAEGCEFCKRFARTYAQVAQAVLEAGQPVVVAKIEGPENDYPTDRFQVSGFPTLFLVKGPTEDPIQFTGARTVEGLLDFLSAQLGLALRAA